MWKALAPAGIILSAVLLFFRHVSFVDGYAIPWDMRGHGLALATAYADALEEGVWPLWEPYAYCGRPLLANPQAAVFYPGMRVAAAGAETACCGAWKWLRSSTCSWPAGSPTFLAGAWGFRSGRRW